MLSQSRSRLLLLALVAAAFALRAPYAAGRMRLTPDVAAYYSISRNLADGQGLVSTLKLYPGSGGPVRHPALSDWPPAYPVFSAVILKLGGDARALQVANALLVSISAGLVFLLGVRLFGMREGLLAGAAAALAPNLFRAGIVALSDALGLTLALAALLVALHEPKAWKWLAAGMIAGAAVLTRYPYALIAVALVGWALPDRKSRPCAIACAIGFACVVGPLLVWQWRSLGLPHSQALHYGVASFHDAMWSATIAADPLYALRHPGPVAVSSLRNCVLYAADLLAGPRGLCLLGIGLAAWAIGRAAPKSRRQQKLVLTVAALNFVVCACTWSIPPVKGSRLMLLSYCLLLPFCAAGLVEMMQHARRWRNRAAVGLCAATIAVYAWGCVTAASFPGTEFALPPRAARSIADWLPPGANLASNNPWVINYSTGAPTALLPRDLDEQALACYVSDLKIGGIVLLGKHPCSATADTVLAHYDAKTICPGVIMASTTQRTSAGRRVTALRPPVAAGLRPGLRRDPACPE